MSKLALSTAGEVKRRKKLGRTCIHLVGEVQQSISCNEGTGMRQEREVRHMCVLSQGF